MSAVHYYTKAGVACGTPWRDVTEVTESFGVVTCFACRKSDVFKTAQVGTDVRPPVAPTQLRYRKGELGRITGSGGQIKVKFVNEEDETKWLNVTSDEFASIEEVLTHGQD